MGYLYKCLILFSSLTRAFDKIWEREGVILVKEITDYYLISKWFAMIFFITRFLQEAKVVDLLFSPLFNTSD